MMAPLVKMKVWGRDDEDADTVPPPAGSFVLAKRCGCGARYDEQGWRELTYVGPFIGEQGELRIMRNCAICHSTISRPFDDEVAP